MYFRIFNDSKLAKEVSLFKDVLATSAYANKVVVAEKDDLIPEGCAIVTVSDKCAAHLMLKGIIDPLKEVEKVGKKQEVLKTSLDKMKKSMEIKDYEKKVPKEVQEANAEKVAQMETEIVRLNEAMAFLKAMWTLNIKNQGLSTSMVEGPADNFFVIDSIFFASKFYWALIQTWASAAFFK